MSTGGSMTHAAFKKTQLDHLINVILETAGDPDHAYHCIADQYPTDNVEDYINLDRSKLDSTNLTKSTTTDTVTISNAMKKYIRSLKGFWPAWGDNNTKSWTSLTVDNFEETLRTDSGPQQSVPAATAPSTTNVTVITNAVSAAMLTKPPASRTDIFMKNKGGGDELKPLKEAKQWNTWQQTFLSVAHAFDFKDITNITYVPDALDTDACTVFDLQQKHAFGLLVSNVKESSVLPIIHKYSDPNATNYGNAQLLYDDLVSHFTKGLSGRQCLEIIEREIDDLHLDSKWGKSCESFLDFIDNKLKDHQGIAPDPTQYPDSWYITQLNHTLEPHMTLYQYIINHQMQADSIVSHLSTTSATTISYKSYVEMIRTFCQTIDHANCKAVHEKNRRKALQAEYQQGGRGRGLGRDEHGDGRNGGHNPGRGRQSGRGHSAGSTIIGSPRNNLTI